jgi:hypothetical protein
MQVSCEHFSISNCLRVFLQLWHRFIALLNYYYAPAELSLPTPAHTTLAALLPTDDASAYF